MSFFSELKRRNVLRMAALYLVAAWLVMQVAEVLIGLGVLPEKLGVWVIAVLAIGLPIALIASWLWDITPEGVVRETDAGKGQSAISIGSRRTDFVIMAMLAAAVFLLLVWEPPASSDEAMTVLPFESMTGPDGASFSEGVSIETQNLLSQLRMFKMRQPPAAAILALFPDVSTLAREMNVRWVLKGSVRRAEQRVRVSVQLIDADDDAAIVWSNVFDRGLSAENLFGIQSEIARSITSELRLSLDQSAERRLAAPPTQNTEAYQAYLLGRQRLSDRHVDWLADAVEQFAHAVEFDENFAGAYSGLFDACHLYKTYSGGHQHERCPARPEGLLKLAKRAVDLDPELGEAWISLARSLELWAPLEHSHRLKKFDEAKAAYERGLELNPNQSQGYLWYAVNLEALFRYPEAGSYWKAWQARLWQSVIAKGLEHDPLSIPLHYAASNYPAYAQTPEEAMLHARRMVEIAPDSTMGLKRLAQYSWSLEGRADEAIRWAHRAAQVDPDQSHYASLSAAAYSALGDFDMALAYLDKAGRLVAEENRESHYALVQRALILLHAGRISEAVEILEREQDWVPTLGMSYTLNALTSLDLAAGDHDKALARYESHRGRCLEQKETMQDWWNCPILEFARILEVTGDSAAAARLLESYHDDTDVSADFSVEEIDDIEDLFLVGNLGKAFMYADYDVARGEQEEALDKIERAVHTGFRGYLYFWGDWRFAAFHDIHLDAIRDDPRFRAAISIIEADMAQQLENVRAMERNGEIPSLDDLKASLEDFRE